MKDRLTWIIVKLSQNLLLCLYSNSLLFIGNLGDCKPVVEDSERFVFWLCFHSKLVLLCRVRNRQKKTKEHGCTKASEIISLIPPVVSLLPFLHRDETIHRRVHVYTHIPPQTPRVLGYEMRLFPWQDVTQGWQQSSLSPDTSLTLFSCVIHFPVVYFSNKHLQLPRGRRLIQSAG